MPAPAATLDALVSRAGQLYSLPAVALEVLRLTSNPTIDTRALKECIERDPALTTRLLRVVNSSLFGLTREVSDLNQALALMGIKPLKLLVLGFSLPGDLFDGVSATVLQDYWKHTLIKAVAAREISQRIAHVPGDDAFLAGLLQDLGKLALIRDLDEPYARLVEQARSRGAALEPLERALFGFDHTQFSARLLAHWGLPASLVEVVGRTRDLGDEDDDDDDDLPPLIDILQMAELLARLLAGGQPEVLCQLLQLGGDRYGLTPQQLSDLVADLEEKVRQLADVLSLQLPDGMSYHALLSQAYSALTEAAAEAATDMLRQQAVEWKESGFGEESLLGEFRQLSQIVAESAAKPTPKKAPAPVAAPVAPVAAAVAVAAPVAIVPAPAATATVKAKGVAAAAPPKPSTAADDSLVIQSIASAVIACRRGRCALSLLLLGLSRSERMRRYGDPEEFAQLRQCLERICLDLDHAGSDCLPRGEEGFALILPDCGRRQAVETGYQLIDQFQQGMSWGRPAGGPTEVTLAIGAATVSLPPPNFPGRDLLVAADRCLYGAHASGGGGLKSIEIY
jgi:HD-like signal output (HDOD) protein